MRTPLFLAAQILLWAEIIYIENLQPRNLWIPIKPFIPPSNIIQVPHPALEHLCLAHLKKLNENLFFLTLHHYLTFLKTPALT
jgi:hypothetical protein